MELQLVSFEQAKALKELGFPQEYISSNQKIYNRKGELTTQNTTFWSYGHEADAPSLELAAKWLREEKNFFMSIEFCAIAEETPKYVNFLDYIKDKKVLFSNYAHNDKDDYWDSYEEALSAGIDKAIEILTKQ